VSEFDVEDLVYKDVKGRVGTDAGDEDFKPVVELGDTDNLADSLATGTALEF